MNTKQSLGIGGSLILCIGVFAPLVSVPIMGSVNYFQNGQGDGTIVLLLAVASLILSLARQYRGLWLSGGASLAILALTFVQFQMKMAETRAQMDRELADNPFRGLAEAAIGSVQLQWGWALLVVGAVLVIAAAAIKDDASAIQPHPPNPAESTGAIA